MAKITNIINSNKALCNNCAYQNNSEQGKICSLSGAKPSFHIICPDFNLSKHETSPLKIEPHAPGLKFFLISFYTWIFLSPTVHLFLSANNTIIAISILSIITLLSLIRLLVSLALTEAMVKKYGFFAYSYAILAIHTIRKKDKKNPDNKIIARQQIIRIFNSIFYFDYKKLFREYNNYKDISKYLKKINSTDRKILFELVCQIYVYDNLSNFKNDGYIDEIGIFLDITYDDIKQKHIEDEEAYIIRKQEEEKRRLEEQKRTNFSFTKSKRSSYFAVLGLPTIATDETIKKRIKELALEYHPDRFINDIEGQKKAVEEFKKITEAYNYIRKQRGF